MLGEFGLFSDAENKDRSLIEDSCDRRLRNDVDDEFFAECPSALIRSKGIESINPEVENTNCDDGSVKGDETPAVLTFRGQANDVSDQ